MKKLLLILLMFALCTFNAMEKSDSQTPLLSQNNSHAISNQSIQNPPRQTMTNDHRSCNNVSCCDGCSQEDKCKAACVVCLLGLSATVILCP